MFSNIKTLRYQDLPVTNAEARNPTLQCTCNISFYRLLPSANKETPTNTPDKVSVVGGTLLNSLKGHIQRVSTSQKR